MARESETKYDLVVRGGTVVCGMDLVAADIGIKDGIITALGRGLGPAAREVDATGRLVLPGGVDVHTHIEQISATGILTADDWASATRSAVLGGTTTVLAFAAQHKGMNLRDVVTDYAGRAAAGALADYGFHLMICNPDAQTIDHDLPQLIEEGHRSVKVFMTYDRLALSDEQLLDVMDVARERGALVCVHAENHGMIAWKSRKLLAEGKTQPRYHAVAHDRLAEREAIRRVVDLAGMADVPLSIFHVSSREGAAAIREARAARSNVYAETCPQYLFTTAADLDRPMPDAAKWMFSPPARGTEDQTALWSALRRGDLQIVSSDHAPYALDETGKLKNGPDATFKEIANGIPGVGLRLVLMFDTLAKEGPRGIAAFASMTASTPARIYGLAPAKGTIAIGADADLVLWDPEREQILTDESVPDATGYTPYAGRKVKGWPETVLRRGQVVADAGRVLAEPGSGRMVTRTRPEGTGQVAQRSSHGPGLA